MKIMLDKHAIGERIRALRGDTSVTVFAAKYDVARQTVYNWETGVNIPEIERLLQIAADSDARADWLLFGLEPRSRVPAYDGAAISHAVTLIEQALQDEVIDLAPEIYGKAVVVALENGNPTAFAAEINTSFRFAVRPRTGRQKPPGGK